MRHFVRLLRFVGVALVGPEHHVRIELVVERQRSARRGAVLKKDFGGQRSGEYGDGNDGGIGRQAAPLPVTTSQQPVVYNVVGQVPACPARRPFRFLEGATEHLIWSIPLPRFCYNPLCTAKSWVLYLRVTRRRGSLEKLSPVSAPKPCWSMSTNAFRWRDICPASS